MHLGIRIRRVTSRVLTFYVHSFDFRFEESIGFIRHQFRKVVIVNGKKIRKWLALGLKMEQTFLKYSNLLFFPSLMDQLDKYIANQLFNKLEKW